MSRWRPALRIAWREALAARGRSLLVLVMIGLPVAGVVAADTLIRTQDVTPREGLARELGAADARVEFGGSSRISQTPLLDGFVTPADGGGKPPKPTAATVEAAFGAGTRAIPRIDMSVRYRTANGVASAQATELDLRDPMTRGLFTLESGRLPEGDEVAVSPALAERGYGVGDELCLADGGTRTIVGVVAPAATRSALVVGGPGSLGLKAFPRTGTFLVQRPGGISWSAVRSANAMGIAVLSRDVVLDPPPASSVDPAARASASGGSSSLPIFALVVVMGLLEVVLLAGPAFAVGARRSERTLALMAATGGEPRDMRRTVLASGVVLGFAGALLGSALGLGIAAVARGPLQGLTDSPFGPFDPSAFHVAGIAAFGLLSAVLAAAAPAWLASRQDVVAVLAGRRGDRPAGRRSPILGAVLLLAGIGASVAGARTQAGGELPIAAGALLAVVGMVLLVPLVLTLLGRLARRFPLPLRFALRDAARHRTRTAPAVAAVAATVVGVTALGIAITSDGLQSERTYTQNAEIGAGVVTGERDTDWGAARAAVRQSIPGAQVRSIDGVRDHELQVDGAAPSVAASYGTGIVVARGGTAALDLGLSEADTRRADRMLAAGGAVVFGRGTDGEQRLTITDYTHPDPVASTTAPVAYVSAQRRGAPAQAIVAPALAEGLGLRVRTTALLVTGATISDAAEERATEAVAVAGNNTFFYVERGFEDQERLIIQLVLGALGAALMLGGTITATFLALSDARPDLSTLAAVGAPPALRRTVAGAYAVTIGLAGTVLGVVVGFVPGLAAGWVVGANAGGGTDAGGAALPTHFLAVPWVLLVVLVVALPLLTAGIAALATRARLPMVARLG